VDFVTITADRYGSDSPLKLLAIDRLGVPRHNRRQTHQIVGKEPSLAVTLGALLEQIATMPQGDFGFRRQDVVSPLQEAQPGARVFARERA